MSKKSTLPDDPAFVEVNAAIEGIYRRVRTASAEDVRHRFDGLLSQVVDMARASTERDSWAGIGGIAVELYFLGDRLRLPTYPIGMIFGAGEYRVCAIVANAPGNGAAASIGRAVVAARKGGGAVVDHPTPPADVERFILNIERWKREAGRVQPTRCTLQDIERLELSRWVLSDMLIHAAAGELENVGIDREATPKRIRLADLSDIEQLTIATLRDEQMINEAASHKAGKHLGHCLAAMKRRGILANRGRGNGRGGYRIADEYLYLLDELNG